MTQRVNEELALDLITDRAAVTAAGDVAHALLLSRRLHAALPQCPVAGFEIKG
jgi:hypothetical protein